MRPRRCRISKTARGIGSLLVAISLLLGSPLLAQGESTDRWLIRLTPISAETAERCARAGSLTAFSVQEEGEPRKFPIRLGEPVSTNLDTEQEWVISIDVPGCWAPETLLEPAATPRAAEIYLWPAGSVTGRLSMARHEETPSAVAARLTPAPGDADVARPPNFTTECPVTDARFDCRLPAGRHDLRIAAEEFIPVYRWDVVVAFSTGTELGEIPLERGASLSGWVATEEAPAGPLRIEVVPETAGGAGSPVGQRLSRRALVVETTERGFFHVRGLAKGSYRLLVEEPGKGMAERAPIVVEEPREYVLEAPLVLKPLVELTASVDPPLDPELLPWSIRLRREIPLSSMYRLEAEDPVDAHGSWRRSGLQPGRYLLQVLDAKGSTHFRQELDVSPGIRPVFIEMSTVSIQGTLHAGETPLSRTLWFHRLDGTRIRMVADSEGRFEGVLPEEGTWKVRLEPTQGRGQQRVEEEVRVVRARGESRVELDIELAATHLIGEVLDEDHRPVAGALVSVYSPRSTLAQVFTRNDGSFEVHGLPEGSYRARAEAKGDRESDLASVALEVDEGTASIELIVRNRRAFRGQVLSGNQPVAGALVRYQVPRAPLEGALHASPDGSFTLWLPAWVEEIDLAILAPGLPAKLTRVSAPPASDRFPPVHLAQVSGDLGIRFPDRQPLYIRGAGDFMPLSSLFLPMDGGKLRGLDETTGIFHLALEPGSYTVCPSPEESRLCESCYLAPGGQLVLDLRQAGRGL